MAPRDYRIIDAEAGITAIRKTHAATNPERHFHGSYELFYLISGVSAAIAPTISDRKRG